MAPINSPSSHLDLNLSLDLNLGDIERKVDMSLDEIIKQSKETSRRQWAKVKSHSKKAFVPHVTGVEQQQIQRKVVMYQNKQLQQRRNMQQKKLPDHRRDFLQRVVASHSSAARQGKLAEARSQNGFGTFAMTRLAAQKALSGNVNPSFNRQRRKSVQGIFQNAGDASVNRKFVNSTQVINGTNGLVAARWPGVILPRKRNWSSKALFSGSMQKLQTLDSRFASLREERQLQQHSAPHARWKR